MMQDQRIVVAILAFIAGVIVAFVMFPRPEVETVYKFETKVESDTIYTRTVDTVYVPKMWIKSQVLRDTILINYQPQISLFKTSIPSEYGSTHVSGEVLGEVLKMTATNDFKIPVVTNTITNTETKTIIQKPKGIYLGASINSLLDPGAKVSYLDNKYLFEYQYQPVTKVHSLGISKKLF
jgi:multisubunit Na+/H+ antiporter MnhF subunit